MLRRGRLLIILGFVLALATTGVAYYLLQQGAAPTPEAEVRTIQVVVALQSIEERTEVPMEAVGIKQWPADSVPEKALRNPAEVAGKMALVPILEGQIILSNMLIDKAEAVEKGGFASFAIPPGKVALAIPVDDIQSVAGAIQAGDFVDVLVTVSFEVRKETGTVTEEGKEETQTVQVRAAQLTLQDVEVLKVGAWNVPPAPETKEETTAPTQNFLTLLVNQQDALVLKYIRDDPNFSMGFALRAVGDHEVVSTESVTLEYMLSRFNIPLPLPPPTIGP